MKPTIRAKIGTHSATMLVLWKDYKQGDSKVLAMELDQWENAHWGYRRLKSCGFWKTFWVDQDKSTDVFLFLIR